MAIYHAQKLAEIHALLDRGQVADARAQIELAVTQEPGNGAAWHLAGLVRRRAGDHAGAVEALRRAISAGRSGAEVWNSLGLALEDSNDLAAARDAFTRALEGDAGYLAAWTNRARIMCLQGEHAAAADSLREALGRFPKAVPLLNALGAAQLDAGLAEEAEGSYRAALAADPRNRVATIRLGRALRDQARAAEAVQLFRQAQGQIEATPEFAEAMAGALTENGERDAAESLLENLCASVPGYFPAHRALVRLAREYGSEKDCYRSYRALVGQWPGEPAIWHEWLSLLLHYKDFSEALQVAEAAEASIGTNESTTFARAIALGESGQAGEAEALFARLEREPVGSTSPYLTSRARNAIRMQDGGLAQQLALRARERDPDDQFAIAYLGLAWRLLGDEREFWLHDYDRQTAQIELPAYTDTARIEELRGVLRELHRARHHPPDQSLRGGTQTEGALFARPHPVIRSLRDAIAEGVAAFIASLPQDDQHPFYRRRRGGFRFTGSWSVRLTQAGFHIAHIHQAGWVSSALHITVPPIADGERPDAGRLVLGEPPSELGLGLPPRRIVEPKEGHLVLFPSSMWHGTVPFEGGAERMTVAFDLIPA